MLTKDFSKKPQQFDQSKLRELREKDEQLKNWLKKSNKSLDEYIIKLVGTTTYSLEIKHSKQEEEKGYHTSVLDANTIFIGDIGKNKLVVEILYNGSSPNVQIDYGPSGENLAKKIGSELQKAKRPVNYNLRPGFV